MLSESTRNQETERNNDRTGLVRPALRAMCRVDVVTSIVTNATMLTDGVGYLVKRPLALRCRMLNTFCALETSAIDTRHVVNLVGAHEYTLVRNELERSILKDAKRTSDFEPPEGCVALCDIDAVDHGEGGAQHGSSTGTGSSSAMTTPAASPTPSDAETLDAPNVPNADTSNACAAASPIDASNASNASDAKYGGPPAFAHTNFSTSLFQKTSDSAFEQKYFTPRAKKISKPNAKKPWCMSVARMAAAARKKVEQAAGMPGPLDLYAREELPASLDVEAAGAAQNAGAQQSWAPHEDELLTRLVAEHGNHWLKIAPKINRSPHSARNRWARLVRLHYNS